jgi:hypothetical protein
MPPVMPIILSAAKNPGAARCFAPLTMIVIDKRSAASACPIDNANRREAYSGTKQQNTHRQAKRSAKRLVGLQRFLPVLNYGMRGNYIPFKKCVKAAT